MANIGTLFKFNPKLCSHFLNRNSKYFIKLCSTEAVTVVQLRKMVSNNIVVKALNV